MRTLKFTQITDDRFDENIKDTLIQRVNILKDSLNQLPGVTAKTTGIYDLTFEDGTKQCRCDFYVAKEGRKVSWDDVYKMVNQVKACPYDFENISFENLSDTKIPEVSGPITDEKAAHLYFYSPSEEYKINIYNKYELDSNLLENKDFLLGSLKSTKFSYAYNVISDNLKNDKEFMLKAINIDGNIQMYASPELKQDKDIAITAVSKFGWNLQEFPTFQADKDVVMTAALKNINALQFASKELLADKDFMFELIQKNPLALKYDINALYCDNVEVVKAAVKQNSEALQHASYRIMTNPSLLEDKPLSLDDKLAHAANMRKENDNVSKDTKNKDLEI